MADDSELFDRLVAADVLVESDDRVELTDSFAATLDIVRSTYGDCSTTRFHEAVAETFGLSTEAAADQIDSHDVTREEFCLLKAIQRFLDDASPETLLAAVGMVDAARDSPVPGSLSLLPEDSDAALRDRDAVVFVFTHGCRPCERLKAEFDGITESLPASVARFGVDGEDAPELRNRYDVVVAPTALFLADGELAARIEGYDSPAAFESTASSVYQ
ncbi:MAG: thioredoxin family protein [Halobacteriales archaeon]|nr:thioredoxin family protein [Halobacteriales archaeon]